MTPTLSAKLTATLTTSIVSTSLMHTLFMNLNMCYEAVFSTEATFILWYDLNRLLHWSQTKSLRPSWTVRMCLFRLPEWQKTLLHSSHLTLVFFFIIGSVEWLLMIWDFKLLLVEHCLPHISQENSLKPRWTHFLWTKISFIDQQ